MRSWWTAQVRRGTAHHAARAKPTSGRHGVVRDWARKFVRFYVPGSPRKRFRPPPTGCSAWRHDTYVLPESTDELPTCEDRYAPREGLVVMNQPAIHGLHDFLRRYREGETDE